MADEKFHVPVPAITAAAIAGLVVLGGIALVVVTGDDEEPAASASPTGTASSVEVPPTTAVGEPVNPDHPMGPWMHNDEAWRGWDPDQPLLFAPSANRCQVHGNETIRVPAGGTLLSVRLVNVDTGRELVELGHSLEDEWEDHLDRVREVVQALEGTPTEKFDAVRALLSNSDFREAAGLFLLLSPDLFAEHVPEGIEDGPGGVEGLFDRIQADGMTVDELSQSDVEGMNFIALVFHELVVILPDLAEDDFVGDTFRTILEDNDPRAIRFTCLYAYPMGSWESLVSHFEAQPLKALASFTETNSRIHAGGDLQSTLLGASGGENLAGGAALMASQPARVQSFGVLLAAAGTLEGEGYPWAVLTVHDGGQVMYRELFRAAADSEFPIPDPCVAGFTCAPAT